MFEINIQDHFSAAHHLEHYHGKCEEQHGHNWIVEVYVKGEELDKAGMLLDFKDMKAALAEVLEDMDHVDLNKLDAFKEMNPSSENIARAVYDEMSGRINSDRCKVSKVAVHETPGSVAVYYK